MKTVGGFGIGQFGIRTKLIALFVLIKVVPLILLALLAWEGVNHLGGSLADETDNIAVEVKATVAEMGKTFQRIGQGARRPRPRKLERLTTDTTCRGRFSATAIATCCWPLLCPLKKLSTWRS